MEGKATSFDLILHLFKGKKLFYFSKRGSLNIYLFVYMYTSLLARSDYNSGFFDKLLSGSAYSVNEVRDSEGFHYDDWEKNNS